MQLGILLTAPLLAVIGLTIPVQASAECRGDSHSSVRVCVNEAIKYSDRRFDYDDVEDETHQVYREVLGRGADEDEIREYARKLDRGESREDIREDIAQSDEAKERIRGTYRELLDRGISSGKVKDYTRKLGRGWTLRDVRADIIDSDEYRGRNQASRRNYPVYDRDDDYEYRDRDWERDRDRDWERDRDRDRERGPRIRDRIVPQGRDRDDDYEYRSEPHRVETVEPPVAPLPPATPRRDAPVVVPAPPPPDGSRDAIPDEMRE